MQCVKYFIQDLHNAYGVHLINGNKCILIVKRKYILIN